MAYVKDSKSAAVRKQLDHPVIDGDGHWLEPMPIFLDYLKQVGGSTLVEHFKSKDVERGWYGMTPEERLDKRPFRPTWWGEPGNTLDRATAMVPRLFYERLDDSGVDVGLLYTSPRLFHLKVAVTARSGSMSWHGRESINNFSFNHIGHFAAASHAFARALIFGGVVKRFPALRFGLLEGGVGWACNLFTDLIAHWEKRSRGPMDKHLRPTNLDKNLLKDLFTRYGGRAYEDKMDELLGSTSIVPPFKTNEELTEREYALNQLDDFEAAGVSSADELRRQFVDHFYFGAEADDPTTAWAFRDPHKLHPLFSSDVSHFDVTDMTDVLDEARELVEHGLITEADFREFTFENAARLHTALNPDFFKGTVVEGAVAKLK